MQKETARKFTEKAEEKSCKNLIPYSKLSEIWIS